MSFLDFLTGKINCPRCGTGGAKEEGGRIICKNPSCAYYVGGERRGESSPAASPAPGRRPGAGRFASAAPPAGFTPARAVTLRYRNFRGEEKEFAADADSCRRFKKHISVCVAPKGVRVALARDRILNWDQVDGALPQRLGPNQSPPTPRERQVLGFHKKYGTTSPLYEQIRAKYPNW